MSSHEQLSPTETGVRLRIAREAANVTQAAAATAIGVARTTLIAIEQGGRRVRIEELQKLAKLFGTSVNALLRSEAVHVDLAPRFRKLDGKHGGTVDAAADLLAGLARAEVELENLLGVRRVRNYPPERPLLIGDILAQAENDAAELRQRFGLGNAPVKDIVTLLEIDMGVRVYVRRFDGGISGLFAYDEAIGACMLLNANHPRERRAQTAAHETGHLLSARRQPKILLRYEHSSSREERYADAFGRALLTPARTVMQRFHEVTAGSSKMSRRHIIVLAHYFGVSREAMARRLEQLSLVKPETWEWFEANGGITDDQVRQVLGDLAAPDLQKVEADRPTTLRLNLLAAEAAERGLLSEGQLARLLRLDRIELREILTDDELEGREANAVDRID